MKTQANEKEKTKIWEGKIQHWHVISMWLVIYDIAAICLSYFAALWIRFDCHFSEIPGEYFRAYYCCILIYAALCVLVFYRLRLYRSIWRFASYSELYRVAAATAITAVCYVLGMTLFVQYMPIAYYLFGIVLQFLFTIGVRFAYRFVLLLRGRNNTEVKNEKHVMLVGAGAAGQMILRDIKSAKETDEQVCCFIDDNSNKWNRYIDGVPVVGGRENIMEASEKTEQKTAIQVLCQDVVNLLAAKYENLGIIVFLRSDMAQNAITTNYEQFKQSYAYAELKWNSDEALKLAVWLVGEAVDGFYNGIKQIENAPKEIIDKHLEKLWGLKLGKPNSNEAYSSRWILAALSDFNGQLQARDIIRFLKYAAVPGSSKKAPYNDRILMPTEIRNAVSTCSEEKITEIRMEYTFLNPIFKKLEELPSDKKVLPLNLDEETILTPSEEKLMTQEGYLVRDGEKSYLPEIVRHALKFKYGKGARPKVLSLLLKH